MCLRRIWMYGGASHMPRHFHVNLSAERLLMEVSHFKWQKSSRPERPSQKCQIAFSARPNRNRQSGKCFSIHARLGPKHDLWRPKRCKKRNKAALTFCEWQMYALCHTRWCCRLRTFTFAALCVAAPVACHWIFYESRIILHAHCAAARQDCAPLTNYDVGKCCCQRAKFTGGTRNLIFPLLFFYKIIIFFAHD